MSQVRKKWRPPLAAVVLIVCSSLLAVPLVAMLALQIGTNWFIRETETSLLKQAAIYAAAFSASFEEETRLTPDASIPGYYLPPNKRVFWSAEVRTFSPFLNVRNGAIDSVRPDAQQSQNRLDPRYLRLMPSLATLDRRASRTTLSGVIFLDYQGLDLRSATPSSFAAVPEVAKALVGEVGAALRWRSDVDARLPFMSIARGTGFRVLVAYPVISSNRVIGAIYISRTPTQIDSYVSQESVAFVLLIAITLLGAAIIGTFLVRAVLRPIQALRDQSRRVAKGEHDNLSPLKHYGLRELAELGDAVLSMADRLSRRRKEIDIYTNHVTHELKSPVTAIAGASELLAEGGLPEQVQLKLLATITAQSGRMAKLLDQLREMTRSRQHTPGQPGRLQAMLPMLADITIVMPEEDAILPLSVSHGEAILTQMAQNALLHGADRLQLNWDGQTLRISDNGRGFSEVDIIRLGEPFFTTRRDTGGTGLGLAIVVAILELYDARLIPVRSQGGAIFDIAFE